MVDAQDLGSCGIDSRGGSSPLARTHRLKRLPPFLLLRSRSIYRDVSAQEALVPETEHAAAPRGELARHPACVPDAQEPPRPEELELHPAGVQATEAEEAEDEQDVDIA